jgi:hypothetical protein
VERDPSHAERRVALPESEAPVGSFQRSTVIALSLAATLVVVSCSSDARRTTDSVAGTTTDPAMLSLGEIAGTWNMRSIPEAGGDTTATTYVLEAKADTSGWTITFPNRPAVPVRVWAQGDSVVTESSYESVRRPGVQVTTHSVFRFIGDSLVGSSVARYAAAGADSVLRLRSSGTRAR